MTGRMAVTYREIFEEAAAEKRDPSIPEVLARALDKINGSEGLAAPPTRLRITDAALKHACDNYTYQEPAAAEETRPRLVIDYRKIDTEQKVLSQKATIVATIADGLLEREGVYEGQKYHITTNDLRVNMHCHTQNPQKAPTPPAEMVLTEKIAVKKPISCRKPG